MQPTFVMFTFHLYCVWCIIMVCLTVFLLYPQLSNGNVLPFSQNARNNNYINERPRVCNAVKKALCKRILLCVYIIQHDALPTNTIDQLSAAIAHFAFALQLGVYVF